MEKVPSVYILDQVQNAYIQFAQIIPSFQSLPPLQLVMRMVLLDAIYSRVRHIRMIEKLLMTIGLLAALTRSQ